MFRDWICPHLRAIPCSTSANRCLDRIRTTVTLLWVGLLLELLLCLVDQALLVLVLALSGSNLCLVGEGGLAVDAIDSSEGKCRPTDNLLGLSVAVLHRSIPEAFQPVSPSSFWLPNCLFSALSALSSPKHANCRSTYVNVCGCHCDCERAVERGKKRVS